MITNINTSRCPCVLVRLLIRAAFTKRSRDNLAWWVDNVVGFHATNSQLAARFAEPPFALPGPGFAAPTDRYNAAPPPVTPRGNVG